MMWHLLRALLVVAAVLDALQPAVGQNDNYYNPNQNQQNPQQPLLPNQQWGNNPQTNQYSNNNQNFGQTNPSDRPPYRTDSGSYNDIAGQDDYNKRVGGGYQDNEEPSLTRGKSSYNIKATFLESLHSREPTYFIVASGMVRPGLIYQVSVSILQAQYPITVHASIACDGVQISGDSKDVKEGIPETLLMRIPPTSVTGSYKLRVEGFYQNVFGGLAFLNETRLDFSQRSMTIFVQTDKPLYMQGETVRFRTIPITTELKGFDNPVDVYMLDPNRHILKRWLSR